MQTGIHVESEEDVATSAISVQKHQSSTTVLNLEDFTYLKAKIVAMQLQINDLYLRNEIKDRGKKFEGSLTRVLILMAITYCTLFGYMIFLGVPRPVNYYSSELNAIVPTVGFNLSTWSLSWAKIVWQYFHDAFEGSARRQEQERRRNDAAKQICISDTV